MKILIIRFSSIGDIVLTTPVIRTLKTQVDDVEVHFATKEVYLPILEGNPYVDKIHVFRDGLSPLIRELRKEDFDMVIDLHRNIRSRMITLALGKKTYSFDKLNLRKWILVKLKINLMPNIHLVDRYMQSVRPLGVRMDELGLDYFIPEKDEVEISWLPETHQNGYAAFVIGSRHSTKQLPWEKMISLCDQINKPIVLIGGKPEAHLGERVENFFKRSPGNPYEESLQELNKKAVVYNACGKFNLNQSASLIKQARWVFSHDTGMMHIAAAFRKHVFSIWGSTVPAFGMYPFRTGFTVFENSRLKCRPCSKIGFKECPKGHFKCMKENVFDFFLPD